MNAIEWNGIIESTAKYLESKTGQQIDKVLITRYYEKGSFQPYHQDKNSNNLPTQVIDVSIGKERELEICHKHISSWKYRMKLSEKRLYIFTHLFNRHFKHRYIHKSNNVNYSLTYRNEM